MWGVGVGGRGDVGVAVGGVGEDGEAPRYGLREGWEVCADCWGEMWEPGEAGCEECWWEVLVGGV